jgi:hypothetical protein
MHCEKYDTLERRLTRDPRKLDGGTQLENVEDWIEAIMNLTDHRAEHNCKPSGE